PVCEPCFTARNPGATPRPLPSDADEPPVASPPQPVPRPRLGLSAGASAKPSMRLSSSSDAGTRAVLSSSLARHAADSAAASIPTPAPTECSRAPSGDPCISPAAAADFLAAQPRIMSPVEVAEKEGLPLPRHIIDPDMAADFDRRGSLQPALRPYSRPRPPPLDTAPLSPSLKNPYTPTTRTASPRSVSFRIDELPLTQSRATDRTATRDRDTPTAENEPAAATNEVNGVASGKGGPTAPAAAPSLADYVLSKASGGSMRPSKLLSVADTIKKFSVGPFAREAKPRAPSIDRKQQLPELQDLIRTHHREPPTEPTVPALNKHNNALKSRPRNSNRRLPQQQQQQPPAPVAAVAVRDDGDAPEQSLAPNQCARCTHLIEETWLRLSDGRQVHEECFTCQQCDGLIADGVYVVEGNQEFHPQCAPPSPPVVSVSPVPSQLSRATKPKGPRHEERCSRCNETLAGPRFQLTNGKQYHQECFACAGCNRHFEEGSYVCFEGQEYHHECAEQVVNSRRDDADEAHLVCGECSQTIEGMFLRHNGLFFHPACFCCVDCRRAITPGMPFGEIGARPCCESCLEARAAQQQQQQQHRHHGWAGANQQQQQQPPPTHY
ncbi:hypothetical protein H4R19_004751, partial [Coemansia spiralis]